MRLIRLSVILIVIEMIGILSCGTLGGFDNISFPITKGKLNNAIDTLYARNPNYIMPDKWKRYNDWDERGYGFLDSRIFYFDSKPEEMYYVSFVEYGNSDSITSRKTEIAIRAVFNGSSWVLEEKTGNSERARIMKRFTNEIVSKLEDYTHTNSN